MTRRVIAGVEVVPSQIPPEARTRERVGGRASADREASRRPTRTSRPAWPCASCRRRSCSCRSPCCRWPPATVETRPLAVLRSPPPTAELRPLACVFLCRQSTMANQHSCWRSPPATLEVLRARSVALAAADGGGTPARLCSMRRPPTTDQVPFAVLPVRRRPWSSLRWRRCCAAGADDGGAAAGDVARTRYDGGGAPALRFQPGLRTRSDEVGVVLDLVAVPAGDRGGSCRLRH